MLAKTEEEEEEHVGERKKSGPKPSPHHEPERPLVVERFPDSLRQRIKILATKRKMYFHQMLAEVIRHGLDSIDRSK